MESCLQASQLWDPQAGGKAGMGAQEGGEVPSPSTGRAWRSAMESAEECREAWGVFGWVGAEEPGQQRSPAGPRRGTPFFLYQAYRAFDLL